MWLNGTHAPKIRNSDLPPVGEVLRSHGMPTQSANVFVEICSGRRDRGLFPRGRSPCGDSSARCRGAIH
jgi:hypothetical protein